ncbi:MAG: carboxypeptidase regulatory-like domain-containing protein [Spirochaetales bacterium]|nr:carboxypeptidase regulatory-like domain-containing protein [Spirochaetales bacterium]
MKRMTAITCILFLAGSVLASFVCAQDPYIAGQIRMEYGTASRIRQTPLKGIEVILECEGIKQVYRTVTDAKGAFYFYNPPSGRYTVSLICGYELLNISRIIVDNRSTENRKSYYTFQYAGESRNLGVLIVEQEMIGMFK